MKNTRVRRGSLEVASRTYYNEFTGRTMKIIGVCHLADAIFWDVVQESIAVFEDTHTGAEVHFEGVAIDDQQLAKKARTKTGSDRFCKVMGLTSQHSGLFFFDHWIRTDLKLSQIQSKMKQPERLSDYVNQDTHFADMADLLEENPRWIKVVHWVIRHIGLVQTVRTPDVTNAVLDLRNRHAVSTMMTTGTDIITVWGASHLHGMGKILTSSGYKLIDTEWNVCISRPAGARHNLIGSK